MIGIFLDIESNGLDPSVHRVLEIALKLVDLDSKEQLAFFDEVVFQPEQIWAKSDPKSLEVNGFTHDIVALGVPEKEVSESLKDLFKQFSIQREKAVYICQNPSFDRSFFSQLIPPHIQEKNKWPYHWLDLASMFWALQLKAHTQDGAPLPWELGISKDKIAQTLGLEKERSPHRAMQGVDHLIECYFSLHACHQS